MHLEPALGNRGAAPVADAVRRLLDLGQRSIDLAELLEHLLVRSDLGQPLDRDARAVANPLAERDSTGVRRRGADAGHPHQKVRTLVDQGLSGLVAHVSCLRPSTRCSVRSHSAATSGSCVAITTVALHDHLGARRPFRHDVLGKVEASVLADHGELLAVTTLLTHSAIAHGHRATKPRSHLGIVRHHDHGRAESLVDHVEQVEHRVARGVVELRRRLVGEQQTGGVGHCDRERNPLLLTA